jgi:hypothetical protein
LPVNRSSPSISRPPPPASISVQLVRGEELMERAHPYISPCTPKP